MARPSPLAQSTPGLAPMIPARAEAAFAEAVQCRPRGEAIGGGAAEPGGGPVRTKRQQSALRMPARCSPSCGGSNLRALGAVWAPGEVDRADDKNEGHQH